MGAAASCRPERPPVRDVERAILAEAMATGTFRRRDGSIGTIQRIAPLPLCDAKPSLAAELPDPPPPPHDAAEKRENGQNKRRYVGGEWHRKVAMGRVANALKLIDGGASMDDAAVKAGYAHRDSLASAIARYSPGGALPKHLHKTRPQHVKAISDEMVELAVARHARTGESWSAIARAEGITPQALNRAVLALHPELKTKGKRQ